MTDNSTPTDSQEDNQLAEIRKDLERHARPWYDTDIRYLLARADKVEAELSRQKAASAEYVARTDAGVEGLCAKLELRDEQLAGVWDEAIEAVPEVGVTFPNGFEEDISASFYREDVITALKSAKAQVLRKEVKQ